MGKIIGRQNNTYVHADTYGGREAELGFSKGGKKKAGTQSSLNQDMNLAPLSNGHRKKVRL